ncbi:MAG: DUF2735 domain-containing protein [Pseudomonadota bacterium]
MTTNLAQPMAKIYQFPVGGRAALNSRREVAQPATDYSAPRVAVISGWYHDAAIEEARRSGEH